jgi:hypothetical protein
MCETTERFILYIMTIQKLFEGEIICPVVVMERDCEDRIVWRES